MVMNTTTSIGILSVSIVTLVLMLLVDSSQSLRPYHFTYHGKETNKDNQNHIHLKEEEKGDHELGMEMYPTGSSLPDCSHACGPCFPCKRVMVSFACSIAESCPIVYRCMCKGKYYHVPSN
ncbi:Protein EPIDERMAL PATTERNING FACTOR 2 [Capsicum baccatum]|uniref:Epidermal patterning factor-like protein n=1 Tax=Capsicum baccatum TaxID=33114 RepID=A0A2G2WZD6_CAPBA|nr:Protein EPIDERMAL PATTERNING FACTOR 2 [Capsicum baccatum]